MVEGKGKLLDELVINRERQESATPSRWPLIAAVAITALLAIAGTWWGTRPLVPTVVAAAANPKPATIDAAGVPPSSASLLDASGYVVARRKATVSAPLGGRVMEVLISEGTRVKTGDVLARLDDGPGRLQLAQTRAQLAAAEAQLQAAQIAFDNAAPIYQRMQRQSSAGFLSAQDLDTAKSTYDTAQSNLGVQREAVAVARADVAIAERNLSDTVIRAPFAGIVTEKKPNPEK